MYIEVENNSKTYEITNYVDIEVNNVNPSGENVVVPTCKFFLKIVKIEFKMRLQSFSGFN